LLITVVYGKEEKARLEVLDCIFHQDPSATCSIEAWGGLLFLETKIPASEATARIVACNTGLVFKIIPVDSVVESDLTRISSEALRLVPLDAQRVAVDCVRRGRVISSSHHVEEVVGGLLKERGTSIDLENPDLVVRIDIIGSRSTISVRPPSGFITKKDGLADG
jgi:tRNA(Ser,Leu) C12 N-acetylase TAN1